jgi:electron transport complex protein RnfB
MSEKPEKMEEMAASPQMSRRNLMAWVLRGAVAAVVTGLAVRAARRSGTPRRMVWQIDPYKCTQCGRCATTCVLQPSAVKCTHAFIKCGYCKLCFGYFQPDSAGLNEAAENQICPTGAIRRTFVEGPYFEYTIDEQRCIGCALCVKGCGTFGNGSLFLQVRHDRCVSCNTCRIAAACPSGAISRVPAETPYMLKGVPQKPTQANHPPVLHI